MSAIAEQGYVFLAVFIHVIIAGFVSIGIDYIFPKYDPSKSVIIQIFEIALQLSLAGILITKLHFISLTIIPVEHAKLVPFGIVEGVVMIVPESNLHQKVEYVSCLLKKWIQSIPKEKPTISNGRFALEKKLMEMSLE